MAKKRQRGRENLVRCEQCGRLVRSDKAVSIEKTIFSNPLDRKEVYDERYVPRLTREVTYCPSCGKHLRVYDKKVKQFEREAEKREQKGFSPRH